MARRSALAALYLSLSIQSSLALLVTPYFGVVYQPGQPEIYQNAARTSLSVRGVIFAGLSAFFGILAFLMLLVRNVGIQRAFGHRWTIDRVHYMNAMLVVVFLQMTFTICMVTFSIVDLYGMYDNARLAVGGYQSIVACVLQVFEFWAVWQDRRGFRKHARPRDEIPMRLPGAPSAVPAVDPDNRWSTKQRDIFLRVIGLVVVIQVGTIVFMALENWSYQEGTYFSLVTLSTIGYGNIVPRTRAGRLFTCVYVVFAVGLMASIFTAVGTLFVSLLRSALKHAHLKSWLEPYALRHRERQHREPQGKRMRLLWFSAHWIHRNILTLLILSFGIAFWLLGALLFSLAESWSYVDAVYFSLVTLSTVGFGDFYPTTQFAIAFWYWFAFVGIAIFAALLSALWTDVDSEETEEEDVSVRED